MSKTSANSANLPDIHVEILAHFGAAAGETNQELKIAASAAAQISGRLAALQSRLTRDFFMPPGRSIAGVIIPPSVYKNRLLSETFKDQTEATKAACRAALSLFSDDLLGQQLKNERGLFFVTDLEAPDLPPEAPTLHVLKPFFGHSASHIDDRHSAYVMLRAGGGQYNYFLNNLADGTCAPSRHLRRA